MENANHGTKYKRNDLFDITKLKDTLSLFSITFSSGLSKRRIIKPKPRNVDRIMALVAIFSIPIMPSRKKPNPIERNVTPPIFARFSVAVVLA